jgi:hypothetical protein
MIGLVISNEEWHLITQVLLMLMLHLTSALILEPAVLIARFTSKRVEPPIDRVVKLGSTVAKRKRQANMTSQVSS